MMTKTMPKMMMILTTRNMMIIFIKIISPDDSKQVSAEEGRRSHIGSLTARADGGQMS